MSGGRHLRRGALAVLAAALLAPSPAQAAYITADWVFARGGYVAYLAALPGERNLVSAGVNENHRQALLGDSGSSLSWRPNGRLGICGVQTHSATCYGVDLALLYDFVISPDGGGPGALTHPYTAIEIALGDGDDFYVTSAATPVIHQQFVFAGTGADDLTLGRGEVATVDAGPGPDRVTIDDVAARVDAGEGDDKIDIDNPVTDTLTCGPGIDRVRADPQDAVAADCEIVVRG